MTKKKDYQALSRELDEVLAQLQQPEVQINQAIALYERGLVLIKELETCLGEAENTIERLKLMHGSKEK